MDVTCPYLSGRRYRECGPPVTFTLTGGQRGCTGREGEGERGRKAVRREFELLISYNYRNIAMSRQIASGLSAFSPSFHSYLYTPASPLPFPPLTPFSVILAIVLRFPSIVPPFSGPHLRAISRKTANLPSQFKLICGGRERE